MRNLPLTILRGDEDETCYFDYLLFESPHDWEMPVATVQLEIKVQRL